MEHAAQSVRIIHDVSVGFTPGGFNAWLWQHILALDMSIGAPPDAFNAEGAVTGLAAVHT